MGGPGLPIFGSKEIQVWILQIHIQVLPLLFLIELDFDVYLRTWQCPCYLCSSESESNIQGEVEGLKDTVSAQKALQGSETDEKESQGAKDSFITLDQDLLKRVKFFW